MVEFVSFTSPHVGQDLETKKRIRSQAMRDYRRRQRETTSAGNPCVVETDRDMEVALRWVGCASHDRRSSSACGQQRASQLRASLTKSADQLNFPPSECPESGEKSLSTPHNYTPAIPYSVSSLPRVDTTERYYLHYFHHVVMKDIAGLVRVGFWDEFVPRMCQSEDVVRQSIVALSRIHADLAYNERLRHPFPLRDRLSSPQSSASYLKASKTVRRYIEERSSPSYKLVLTCSIVFHAIELLQGAEASALCHLENGLAMFKAWKRRRQRSLSEGQEGFDEIATVLARLDLSATIAYNDRIPIFEYDQDELLSPSVCDSPIQMKLTSTYDAHYQLLRANTPVFAFLIRNKHFRDVPIDLVPDTILEERCWHLRQWRAWSIAADQLEWDISTRKRDESTSADIWERDQRVATVSLLVTRMYYWCTKCLLEECLQDKQYVRPFDRNSHKVLRYARSIIKNIKAVEDGANKCRRMSFSPETAVCSILFILAHRTTDPKIRIEALHLARHFNRLEGARDLISAFELWTLLPNPKPGFSYMLSEPGLSGHAHTLIEA